MNFEVEDARVREAVAGRGRQDVLEYWDLLNRASEGGAFALLEEDPLVNRTGTDLFIAIHRAALSMFGPPPSGFGFEPRIWGSEFLGFRCRIVKEMKR